MKLKMLLGATLGAVMAVSAASAATLSIVGGAAGTLPSTFNPAPDTGYNIGDAITVFTSASIVGNGLVVSDPAAIRYTFLGKEAGALNAVMELGGQSISNTAAAGTSIAAMDASGGFVDFLFSTIFNSGTYAGLKRIYNGGPSEMSGLQIAFVMEDSKNAVAFFGDGRGDNDFDDMVVRISIVPLPAGGLLLLTALGGLGVARRRKKAA